MRRLIVMATMAVVTGAGVLQAEDAKLDRAAQWDKIQALRKTVMHKMPVLADLFDNAHNGWDAAGNSLLTTYQTGNVALQKRIEEENAKPAEARDKLTMDGLNAKAERVNAVWGKYCTKDIVPFRDKQVKLSAMYQSLAGLVDGFSRMDQMWQRAECDQALLLTNFMELDHRTDEVIEQATALLADYKKLTASLEKEIKE